MRDSKRTRRTWAPAPRAESYNAIRRRVLDDLTYQIRDQTRGWKLRLPVVHECLCIEPDRKRDPDNVYAGAVKLVFDALVLAGAIPNDTQEYVGACFGWNVRPKQAGETPGVYLRAPDRDGVWHWLKFGLLPGQNEMSRARELGARRSMGRAP